MPKICFNCVRDEVLREQLMHSAKAVTCTYCEQTSPGLELTRLASHVDGPLRSVLRIGELNAHFSSDSDSPSWEQDGDDLSLYLQELLEIEYEPAEALVDVLINGDPADPRDGGEPFYARAQLYQLAEVTDGEFAQAWREFSDTLKHHQRFFGSITESYLARIIGEPQSQEASELPAFTIEAASEKLLVRARRAHSADVARKYLEDPAKELSGPPPDIALAGRMNPAGISVFYGSMSPDVAIAEVRPPVGSFVVIGAFRPSRSLRLLDLTALHTLPSAGSIFGASYHDRVARRQFLRGFHHIIIQPVQPQDEPLEYLPTQAVAEYVRNVLGFDGILYGSTQAGTLNDFSPFDDDVAPVGVDGCNVVIFGRRSQEPLSDWREPRSIPEQLVVFPLNYENHSAYGVWVRKVAYTAPRVNLDDERGDPGF